MNIYSVYIWQTTEHYKGWQIAVHDLTLDEAIAEQQFYEYIRGFVACVHSKYSLPEA